MCVVLLQACWILKPKPPETPTRPDFPTITLVGYDWLAAQSGSFNLGEALELLPQGTQHSIGSLDFTFGESLAPVNLILGSGKVGHYRVHFLNGPCVRNKNCGPYEPTYNMDITKFNAAITSRNPQLISHFRSRVKLYCDLMDAYPSTRFYLSWVLEHNLTLAAWKVLDEEGRAICPRTDYYVVNNPVGSHNFPPYPREGVLYEDHGKNPKPGQLTSLDGEEVTDIDVPAWLARTKSFGLVYVWSRAYNCRPVEPFIDPRTRTQCPDKDLHEELIHIIDPRPAPINAKPPQCTSLQQFNAPSIWKPLSENYGDHYDSRGNLPVAITPFNSGYLRVLDYKGNDIGALKYYGTFQGGLFRHYSGLPGASAIGGYQFEKRAVQSSASPWVYLRRENNNQCIGPLIPGRRAGVYR